MQSNQQSNKYIKPLDYYLSADGSNYLEFKEWINLQNFDSTTGLKLILCCKNLETSGWLDTERRKLIFQKIKTILEAFVFQSTRKTPYNYFLEYITDLDKHCFQGGYGHYIHYKYINNGIETYQPHHWMISPTNYPQYANIPSIITLCATICGFYIRIEEHPEQAYWTG